MRSRAITAISLLSLVKIELNVVESGVKPLAHCDQKLTLNFLAMLKMQRSARIDEYLVKARLFFYLLLLCSIGAPVTADNYESGLREFENQRFEAAYAIWLPLANKDDAYAQYSMGLLYENGTGVEQSYKKAFEWFQKSAALGLPKGNAAVGNYYDLGFGVNQNFEKAMYHYLLAAEKGNTEAMRLIGHLYLSGEGVEEDHVEAVNWYRKSANLGNDIAQRHMGDSYDNGTGVPQNYDNAIHWYSRSAAQNNRRAQVALGNYYEYGLGVEINFETAEHWYLKAYNDKNRFAFYPLAQFYMKIGNLDKLRSLCLEAVAEARDFKLDRWNFEKFDALLMLASTFRFLGMNSQAIELYSDILRDPDFQLKADHWGSVDTLHEVALAFASMEQPRLIEMTIEAGIDRFMTDEVEDAYDFAFYHFIKGEMHFLDQNYAAAIAEYEASARFEMLNQEFKIRSSIGIGNSFFAMGKYSKAIEQFRPLLVDISPSDIAFSGAVYIPLIRSHFLLDEIDQAYLYVKEFSKINEYFYDVGNVSSATEYQNISAISATLESLIAAKIYSINSNYEALDESYLASQNIGVSAVSVAANQMSQRKIARELGIGDLLRRKQDAELKYFQNSNEIMKRIANAGLSDRGSQFEELRSDNTYLEVLLKSIDEQIYRESPSFFELFLPQPLSLSDTQDLLGLNEGLFTFVSDEETEATYAFMVTKDDARAYQVDLSEAQIAEIVSTLRAGIDLSNSFGIGDLPNFDMNLSYHLYSSLFGPAEDMLDGVEHLLVVPTGPLESLPLNLLVTEKPEIDPAASVFDNYQAAAWLPKSYSLTRLPSVSSLRALRVFAATGEAKEPFIGFGDPILNGDAGDLRGLELASVYRGTTADIDQVRNLPELPDTADELKRIAQYLRAPDDKIYLRERATETFLKNTDLTNSRVVAFATHGLVGGEISGLAEPALVLSPPDEATEEDDGLLKASEVAQLKMNADIIMLSACNTASGDELGAEGLSGLARAFIYAGARSLLVSHWSVESTSAAELTTGMFDAMSADKSIGRSEALQMSMVDLMTDKERSYYSHPAFWAPFSLVGDGATLN